MDLISPPSPSMLSPSPPDFQWMIPSFYGDVTIKVIPSGCRVEYEKLSPQEVVAIRALRDRAEKKGWARADTFDEIPADDSPYRGSGRLVSVDMAASVDDVRKALVRAMKPGRAVLSVVRFSGGAIEELVDVGRAVERSKMEKAKAADVGAPTIGCPAPDFERAEVRATRVLREFLDPVQIADFERMQSFVARGVDTGHAYMITSRQARHRLEKYERSLYDLDEGRALCVHDWTVASAEEMLALLAFISVPNGERYVRYLPEDPRPTEAPVRLDMLRACWIPEGVA